MGGNNRTRESTFLANLCDPIEKKILRKSLHMEQSHISRMSPHAANYDGMNLECSTDGDLQEQQDMGFLF